MNNTKRCTQSELGRRSELGNEPEQESSLGHVYILTHSIFSDVVNIGCTQNDPEAHTKWLTEKTIGEYTLCFSLQCNHPCQVKDQIQKYLNPQRYINEFFQVSPEVAQKLIIRETLKIPDVVHLN